MDGSTAQILVVDDDTSQLRLIRHWLVYAKYEVRTAETADGAEGMLSSSLPDAILLDVHLPDGSGVDLLQRVQEKHPGIPVIMLTAESGVAVVVQAMQAGAWDYLTKPVDRQRLLTVIRNAVEKSQMQLRLLHLEREASGRGYPGIIGNSLSMQRMFRQMDRIAPRDITALIRGESGTGKELIAHALHDASRRRTQPFIALNCAAIPETLQESELFGHEKGAFTGAQSRRAGRFEQAHGGTLFLDEVGELSLSLQAKLLRALQERSFYRVGGSAQIDVDVRIIAATHRDLNAMVREGEFREDLYYRLAVFELSVPPLHQRGNDLMQLTHHFINQLAAHHQIGTVTITDEALARISAYGWPGNVRELRNAIERAVVLADNGKIQVEDLPERIQDITVPTSVTPTTTPAEPAPPPAKETLSEMERRRILEAMQETGGNVSEVVRRLGIPRSTLYRRLREYGLR